MNTRKSYMPQFLSFNMKTEHKFYKQDSRKLSSKDISDIDLVITSPPYPMIEMWDDIFSTMNENIEENLESENGSLAFEKMHEELDKVWEEIDKVISDKGIVCINIGDATRKIGDDFEIYPNHARIINKFSEMNYSMLPSILWRKPTNKASKFMGSGMIPPNAYVTLEHEHILIFRKDGLRSVTGDDRKNRYNSSYFWEERNKWFSDLWTDITGEIQRSTEHNSREVTAAYPFTLPYRLIQMYSIQGDTILDPFLGTGTTSLASASSARNSIGFEISEEFINSSRKRLQNSIKKITEQKNTERIQSHIEFINESNKTFKYTSKYYDFDVTTKQERKMKLYNVSEVRDENGTIHINYEFFNG